ncbi:MAG: hypothetical protein ABFS24_00860 [Pseudomonadota bacterium]
MLKKTVVIFAAAAFFGEAVPTQTAQARDYYDDDEIWDLMNPSWWADEFFDDDDDDWRYYQHRPYNPYWGPPYAQHPRIIVIQPEPETKNQPPEIRVPE